MQVAELPWAGSAAAEAGGVAVAEPMVVHVLDEPVGRHIAILDASDGGRVVTVIEFLSPSNKLRGDGREHDKLKQAAYQRSNVNLVEIDLLRAGEFTVALPADSLFQPTAPYHVCVRRSAPALGGRGLPDPPC